MALYGGNIFSNGLGSARRRREAEGGDWRVRTEAVRDQYEREMWDYLADIVQDLEAYRDIETFKVDTI